MPGTCQRIHTEWNDVFSFSFFLFFGTNLPARLLREMIRRASGVKTRDPEFDCRFGTHRRNAGILWELIIIVRALPLSSVWSACGPARLLHPPPPPSPSTPPPLFPPCISVGSRFHRGAWARRCTNQKRDGSPRSHPCWGASAACGRPKQARRINSVRQREQRTKSGRTKYGMVRRSTASQSGQEVINYLTNHSLRVIMEHKSTRKYILRPALVENQ